MEKIWDVTIMKIGSVEIMADTEEEAIMKADAMDISKIIKWEDSWNAVDACLTSN